MKQYIKRSDLKRSPQLLFVFGDNDVRKGLGGMAKEFRGESNAIGVRVKKKPSLDKNAFYTDTEYEDNIKKINEDFDNIKKEAKKYMGIWISERMGKGLAKLDKKAPKTYEYLLSKIEEIKELYK